MFLFLFFSMLLLCSFFILKVISSEKWCNYVVTFFLKKKNAKNLGRSDDGKRRKKKRMALDNKKTCYNVYMLVLSTLQSLVCFVDFLLSFLAYSMFFGKYTKLFSYLDPRRFCRGWKHVRKGHKCCKANNSNSSSLQVFSLVKIFTLETFRFGDEFN